MRIFKWRLHQGFAAGEMGSKFIFAQQQFATDSAGRCGLIRRELAPYAVTTPRLRSLRARLTQQPSGRALFPSARRNEKPLGDMT
jgi:hypothetical protein